MKAVIATTALAVLFALPAAIHAAAPQPTAIASDATLDSRIHKRIQDSTLKKYDVRVSVADGVATITGTVATEADRRKAAQLATIPGVARIDNRLVVDMSASKGVVKGTAGAVERGTAKGAEKTKEGVDKAAEGIGKAAEKTQEGVEKGVDKTKEGTAKAADKSAEGIGKAGEAITDVWIKTRVKTKFVGEDLLKDSDIGVDVNDHVVTLSGTVLSEAGRMRAVEEAKAVDGVHSVIDRLRIGPPK